MISPRKRIWNRDILSSVLVPVPKNETLPQNDRPAVPRTCRGSIGLIPDPTLFRTAKTPAAELELSGTPPSAIVHDPEFICCAIP
jgi:hypothetical protein